MLTTAIITIIVFILYIHINTCFIYYHICMHMTYQCIYTFIISLHIVVINTEIFLYYNHYVTQITV